jgi:signal transduction histidine kinase
MGQAGLRSEFPGRVLRIERDRSWATSSQTQCGLHRAVDVLPFCAGRSLDAVEFGVADTGCGISPADLPHIFSRYWQAPEAARLGSGLGLSIVEGIVAAHDGRVHVSSTLGKGSVFTFTLPVADSGGGMMLQARSA